MKWISFLTLVFGLFSCSLVGCNPTTTATPVAQAETKPEEKGHYDSLGFSTNFTNARIQSQQSGKPMLIFFTTDNCRFCDVLAKNVLCRTDVSPQLSNFICVEVNAVHHPEVCNLYGARAYPTLVFLNSQGQEINRIVGAQPVETIQSAMNVAIYSQAKKFTLPKK